GDRAKVEDGAGTRSQRGPVPIQFDPGVVLAVTEAKHEVRAHRDLTFDPLYDANEIVNEAAEPRRHEVDDADLAPLAAELGLEDERVLPIALFDAERPRGGSHRPVAVLVRAEELSKASVGVDAWHAEPVDRARARDQRDGRGVADDAVVL